MMYVNLSLVGSAGPGRVIMEYFRLSDSLPCYLEITGGSCGWGGGGLEQWALKS